MFVCSNCDAQSIKWAGRCTVCGAWGTLEEDTSSNAGTSKSSSKKTSGYTLVGSDDVTSVNAAHKATKISEFDRVLGGGIVPGSVILLAGEPGIGKSTLIGQLAGFASKTAPLLLSSGEESASQIFMRLNRLNIPTDQVQIVQETTVESVRGAAEKVTPSLVVIDSIQTATTNTLDKLAGAPTQIRAATALLVGMAKELNIPVVIVGQMTKDGTLAGPKMLEHMVDVVLELQGDSTHPYRMLYGLKNRFGTTNEVGIFEMTGEGLVSVENPSERFLQERSAGPGSIVTCIMEGHRPYLIEVQALIDKTSYGYPVRRSSGFDVNRLQLLIAIANRYTDIDLSDQDVYINIVGGMKIKEPALDLAVIAAMISAKKKQPIKDACIIGEVGLAGEIRSIPFLDRRLQEIERFGMKSAYIPKRKMNTKTSVETKAVSHVSEIM